MTDHSEYRPFFPWCKECLVGYYPFEEKCVECSSAVEDCEECELDSKTGEPYCTVCGDDKIPSADGLSCVEKLANCWTPPERYEVDEDGDYICYNCTGALTWTVSATTKKCDICSNAIPNCQKCDLQGRCQECNTGFFPDYKWNWCVANFTNCLDASWVDHKIINEDHYECKTCVKGFAFDVAKSSCTIPCTNFHESCTSCDASTCNECSNGWMLSKDKKTCVAWLDNCKV